jgi:hypothetical protein
MQGVDGWGSKLLLRISKGCLLLLSDSGLLSPAVHIVQNGYWTHTVYDYSGIVSLPYVYAPCVDCVIFTCENVTDGAAME